MTPLASVAPMRGGVPGGAPQTQLPSSAPVPSSVLCIFLGALPQAFAATFMEQGGLIEGLPCPQGAAGAVSHDPESDPAWGTDGAQAGPSSLWRWPAGCSCHTSDSSSAGTCRPVGVSALHGGAPSAVSREQPHALLSQPAKME